MELPAFIVFKVVLAGLAMAYGIQQVIAMRRDLRRSRKDRGKGN